MDLNEAENIAFDLIDNGNLKLKEREAILMLIYCLIKK